MSAGIRSQHKHHYRLDSPPAATGAAKKTPTKFPALPGKAAVQVQTNRNVTLARHESNQKVLHEAERFYMPGLVPKLKPLKAKRKFSPIESMIIRLWREIKGKPIDLSSILPSQIIVND